MSTPTSIRKQDIVISHPCASGGIAELVYASRHDGSMVVLRQLLPKYVLHWTMHRRFVKGTRVRVALSPHPHIVGSLNRGYECLRPYEVIEYAPGYNVSNLVRKRHPFVATHALQILQQTADAVAHMHSRGYLHLDLKGENLILDPTKDKPHVKLTDFDLSIKRETSPAKAKRNKGGTLTYMAPEQAKKALVDERTDVFAFGILAYFLLTWRMPFAAEDRNERYAKQFSTKSNIEPLRKFVPELSPAVEELVMGCLAKQHSERIPSMAYIKQELQRVTS